MLKRKPFALSPLLDNMADLTVDPKHIPFVESLPYVSQVESFTMIKRDYFRVWFDRRYNAQDAYDELKSDLTSETSRVELSDVWDESEGK